MKRWALTLLSLAFGIASAASADPADIPPMKVGTVRPAIDFSTLKDRQHPNWETLRGKIVVIDFWATWCAPCVKDFPVLNALQAKYAGKPIVFYSVTYEKAGGIADTLSKFPLETTIGLDNDFRTYKSFNAWGIPVVYIFDGTGTLVADLHPDELNAGVIEAVLAGRKPTFVEAKQWSDPAGAETYFRSLRDKQAD